MTRCELCDVTLSTKGAEEQHSSSQKHIRLLDLQKKREAVAERSVFVCGLKPQKTNITDDDLCELFTQFGKINNIGLQLDTKQPFAIVEFETTEAASSAVARHKMNYKDHFTLCVKPRKIKSMGKVGNGHKKMNLSSSSDQQESGRSSTQTQRFSDDYSERLRNNIIQQIERSTGTDSLITNLENIFCLDDVEIEKRIGFTKMVTELLQQFWPDLVTVQLYGSSVHGVAYLQGSDIDCCLTWPDITSDVRQKLEKECYFPRSVQFLLDAKPQHLRNEKKLHFLEFLQFDHSELVKLMFKILNFLTTDNNILLKISKVQFISNGRCPIVKFDAKYDNNSGSDVSSYQIQISINNKFAVTNTRWMTCLLSNRIVRILIMLVRSLASYKNIQAPVKSHVSSYALNLIVVSFLQHSQLLKPTNQYFQYNLQLSRDNQHFPDNFGETQLFEKLPDRSVELLFIQFVHFIATIPDFSTCVFCPYVGGVQEVKNVTNLVSRSVLNVQDPFDLEHNTTSTVSKRVVDDLVHCARQMETFFFSNCSLYEAFRKLVNLNVEKDVSKMELRIPRDVVGRLISCTEQFVEMMLLLKMQEMLSRIFVDVLLFERSSHYQTDDGEDDAHPGDSEEHSGDAKRHKPMELVNNDGVLNFNVRVKTWLSRRSHRREAQTELGSDNSSHFEIERRISEIVSRLQEATSKKREVLLKFECKIEFNKLDNDCALFSLKFSQVCGSLDFTKFLMFLHNFLPHFLSHQFGCV